MKICGTPPDGITPEITAWCERQFARQVTIAQSLIAAHPGRVSWEPLAPGVHTVVRGRGVDERSVPVRTVGAAFTFSFDEIAGITGAVRVGIDLCSHRVIAAVGAVISLLSRLSAGEPTPIDGPELQPPVWVTRDEDGNPVDPHILVNVFARIATERT